MAHLNSDPTDMILDQIGIVVRDLYPVAEKLHELIGIGPFRVLEWPIEGIDPESTYHGRPAQYRILLAFARLGATQLELIQPIEGPNIWTDFLNSHGPGLHHFRCTVQNFDETVAAWEAAGIKNIASGTGAHIGSKWAYFDTSELLDGIVIELRTRMDDANGEGQWAAEGIEIGGDRT
jgi:methylmalonyl-CoA/ethylmalonyl-CoA epimerase